MKVIRTAMGATIVGGGEGGRDLAVPQIIGVGLNYRAHAVEQNKPIPERPLVFSKNLRALCAGGDEIVVPKVCQDREQVDFEGELAIVIGRGARDVARERAADFVLGYAAANDVSARWWQNSGAGGQYFRGKGFDTFCPLSDVTPAREVRDPQALRIVTRVNGHVMQDGTTGDMIFDCLTLLSELSRGMTLLAGTVILTGTPSGVGAARTPPVFLKGGDEVVVEIAGAGRVQNRVRFE